MSIFRYKPQPVADIHEKFWTHRRSNFLHFHAVLAKFGKIIGWRYPLGLPAVWEILDPPLTTILHVRKLDLESYKRCVQSSSAVGAQKDEILWLVYLE